MTKETTNQLKLGTIGIISAFLLAGCSQNPSQVAFNNPQPANFYGGVIGTSTENYQTNAFSKGALAGELVGLFYEDAIDQSLDVANRLKIANILEFKPSNQWQSWTDAQKNVKYSIRPGRPIFSVDGSETCREYDLIARIQGETSQASGFACRKPNGNWLLNS